MHTLGNRCEAVGAARQLAHGAVRSWWPPPALLPGWRRQWSRGAAVRVTNAEGGRVDEPLELRMRRLEAVLFLGREPINSRKLAQFANLADGTEARTLIRLLNQHYDESGRAFRVEEVAGGFQLLTRPMFAAWLRRLQHLGPETRLTPPAMETLAVVAYRQPVLRADIEAIRGVSSGEMLRQLMDRELVRVSGRSEELGRPYLYSTTKKFLRLFGLPNLDALPEIDHFRLHHEDPVTAPLNPEESKDETDKESIVTVMPAELRDDEMLTPVGLTTVLSPQLPGAVAPRLEDDEDFDDEEYDEEEYEDDEDEEDDGEYDEEEYDEEDEDYEEGDEGDEDDEDDDEEEDEDYDDEDYEDDEDDEEYDDEEYEDDEEEDEDEEDADWEEVDDEEWEDDDEEWDESEDDEEEEGEEGGEGEDGEDDWE
ncbi:MAG: SMC-Scp complex subunit ScpB [Planctomycetales bacterium]|nr:SMC-Scp complex subunit ScpB [Planctomycetales bacterium]